MMLRHQFIRSCVAEHQTGSAGDTALSLWTPLASETMQIIGEVGFDAIYEKCLFVTLSTYPWLGVSPRMVSTRHQFSELHQCLAIQEDVLAEAGNLALLCAFTDILASLIGERLTSRILYSAWGKCVPEPTDKEPRHA